MSKDKQIGEAIQKLVALKKQKGRFSIDECESLDIAIKILRDRNKQKYKKWIIDRCDMYICPECNRTYTDLSGEQEGMNYCSNCGIKLTTP